VFENRLLSKILGPMREVITGDLEDYVMTMFITLKFRRIVQLLRKNCGKN
jgi:hypothetical protein